MSPKPPLQDFDPNSAAGADGGVYGLPFTEEQAAVVYLPVPWEATTSYGGGTSDGPKAILEASRQVDLFDVDVLKPYAAGLFMLPEDPQVREWNRAAKAAAKKVIDVGGEVAGDAKLEKALARTNELSETVTSWVRERTERLLAAGKTVGLVGGDHSCPLGAFEAFGARGDFGILHFDAHLDTRIAYEGFVESHASIMYNALERVPALKKLVQVGIRDFCEQEYEYCRSQGDRVRVFYDRDLARGRFEGRGWAGQAEEIVESLPERVWVSFDIDGLDPRFCPHTGTPVPGGLDFREAVHLIGQVARSGRKLLGFDLCEVSPSPDGDEWDANVGARLLYKLTGWSLASQGKAKIRP